MTSNGTDDGYGSLGGCGELRTAMKSRFSQGLSAGYRNLSSRKKPFLFNKIWGEIGFHPVRQLFSLPVKDLPRLPARPAPNRLPNRPRAGPVADRSIAEVGGRGGTAAIGQVRGLPAAPKLRCPGAGYGPPARASASRPVHRLPNRDDIRGTDCSPIRAVGRVRQATRLRLFSYSAISKKMFFLSGCALAVLC